MQGTRRRPYVDMVEEGNTAADRPGRNPGGDGAIRAHLFVGSPRNIDILLRALLLDLHPTSPPSHPCLAMKQVLAFPTLAFRALSPCRDSGGSWTTNAYNSLQNDEHHRVKLPVKSSCASKRRCT